MSRFNPILLTFFLICLAGLPNFAAGQELMSVQVRSGPIRSTPSFLGKIMVILSYGDQVKVLEKKGAWMKVGLPGSNDNGWIHISALTKKKILLKFGTTDVTQAAFSNEVALAGKGFNAQVENAFKAKNAHVNYAWIKKMEAEFAVSQNEIQRFLEDGGLTLEGGAE